MRKLVLASVMAAMGIQTVFAQGPATYSICLAAPPPDDDQGPIAPGMDCKNSELSIQIGSLPKMPWPSKNTKLENVALRKGDRIAVFCKDKPQQSFRFSARWLQSHELLIHLDGYRLVQLFDAKDKPWYKCTKS